VPLFTQTADVTVSSTLKTAVAVTAALVLLQLGVPHAGAQTGHAPRAAAAVTLGQVATSSAVACAATPNAMAQYAAAAGRPSYTTPTAGVITSYSIAANETPGSVRLLIFGSSPTPGHRTVIAKDALRPVTVSTVNTFPVRMPVAAGVTIGFSNKGVNPALGMTCWGAGVAGDEAHAAVFDPDSSSDYPGGTTFTGKRINVSAVLEPDVDQDQYGDLTQDLCPQSKLTQAACPAPDTDVTKRPKKRSATRKAKIKFVSTIAGSTFTCAVDGKAAKPCTSPFKKKYGYGKHTVLIVATSPYGIVEPRPAKVKFKVKRRAS
jgi:hypothetical protein